jgi:glycosyltransferase involved in cell wall biosynthesis
MAQYWLLRNVKDSDQVLCFGSIPPLFSLPGHTSVFVQNKYLIDNSRLSGFRLKIRARLILERLRLRFFSFNADEFIVQTSSMRADMLMRGWLSKLTPIRVSPFLSTKIAITKGKSNFDRNNNSLLVDCDFIYVATSEPHKNHINLIEAWSILARQNLFPSLYLTIDRNSSDKLLALLEKKIKAFNLKIFNLGLVPNTHLQGLYSRVRALIYPSTLESFGIPLIEARNIGLPIIASELDYVRDLVDPDETFDPHSALSIARAVKRFIGRSEIRKDILSAKQFWELLVRSRLE